VWDWIGNRAVWEGRVDVSAAGEVEYAITTWEGDPATWPSLRIRAEVDGKRLPVLDAAGHALSDTLSLTPVVLARP
jgi:hypothetical protein